jgi:hypothetical protein
MKGSGTAYDQSFERGAVLAFPSHVAEVLIREGQADALPDADQKDRSVNYAASLPHSVRS